MPRASMKFSLGKIIAVLVVLAAAGGGWAWYASRNAAGETKYRVGKLERGPLQAVVVASGTLAAEGVAVDGAGNVYGAEVGPKKVQKYVMKK